LPAASARCGGRRWVSGIIATISNAFSLADVNPYYQDIVKGCIIVGALALDVYARRLAGRAGRPSGGDRGS
jgi:ribose/xylose/arabinose/galactoside ABC-type transport system permease subunit